MQGVEELIGEHNHVNAMTYTPRQVNAFLFLARRRQKRSNRNMLQLMTLAFRGKKEAVEQQLKDTGD